MDPITLQIESLIFAADDPLLLSSIQSFFEDDLGRSFEIGEIEARIGEIQVKYESDDFPFELVQLGGGYTFLTKSEFHPVIASFLKKENPRRLSRVAMETLAIVAYKQPVSKNEIEQIRGVNSDYTIQKLLQRELVDIVGRSEGPGRPLLYGTSDKFMKHFGLRNVNDLPSISDFEESENSIGEQGPSDEMLEEE